MNVYGLSETSEWLWLDKKRAMWWEKRGKKSLRKDRKKWGEEGNQKEKWEDGRDEKKRLRSK